MKKEEYTSGMVIINERLVSRTKNEITTEYTYLQGRSKKEKKMLLTYTYVEPKNKEEKEERERSLRSLYKYLFEETLKDWNQPDKIEERLKQSKNKDKMA